MSARIRISTGGIPIEVNDNGDTIELRTDADFMKECLNIQRNFRVSAEKYEALLNDENAAPEAVSEAIDEVFKTTDSAIRKELAIYRSEAGMTEEGRQFVKR